VRKIKPKKALPNKGKAFVDSAGDTLTVGGTDISLKPPNCIGHFPTIRFRIEEGVQDERIKKSSVR